MEKWKKKASKLWGEIVHRTGYCAICGDSYKLNAHHILERSTYQQYRVVIGNGILLCQRHHALAHLHKLIFLQRMKEKAPTSYKWYIWAIQQPKVIRDENGHVAKFGEDYYEKTYNLLKEL